MYLHADNKDSDNWDAVNLDTGEIMTNVKWMDDEKGEYAVYKYENSEPCLDNNGKTIIEIKTGNVKLVKKDK